MPTVPRDCGATRLVTLLQRLGYRVTGQVGGHKHESIQIRTLSELLSEVATAALTPGAQFPLRQWAWVTVEHVLAMPADGVTTEELLREYPFLEAADTRACLAYAH